MFCNKLNFLLKIFDIYYIKKLIYDNNFLIKAKITYIKIQYLKSKL